MLLKVVQEFEDKYTKEIHKINATINVSKARGDELLASIYKLVEKDIMNIDSEVDPDADEGTNPDADDENISKFPALNFQQLKKICVEKGFDVSEINTKKELLELLNK